MRTNDLPSPGDFRRIVTEVLTAVPFLSELSYYMAAEECGEVANTILEIEDELRHEAKHYPSHELRYSARDLLEDIQNTASAAISYNNNPWNFAPCGAPEPVRHQAAMLAIVALLDGRQRKAELPDAELFLGPGSRPKTVLQVIQRSARRWDLVEWFQRNDESSSYAESKLISRHSSRPATLKAKDNLLDPPCPHDNLEHQDGYDWCHNCGVEMKPTKRKNSV